MKKKKKKHNKPITERLEWDESARGYMFVERSLITSDQALRNLLSYKNQPERLNETDHLVGADNMICDSLNTANKTANMGKSDPTR